MGVKTRKRPNNINLCIGYSTVLVGTSTYMSKKRGLIYKGLIPDTVNHI
jgi:hypothetical protein